ncbi:hypothetical protein C436_20843 [Haloarcula marismortui ATCC 33800]|uniref:Uncharacterized protein n=1 Tax=Haloarcula marismortui ATCC 33800 TaxID=662476 RepID=M0JG30_9EURY|nr:hypothetical protein C436_20843 [Haloarcula sinaiiensis ATCC 33800]
MKAVLSRFLVVLLYCPRAVLSRFPVILLCYLKAALSRFPVIPLCSLKERSSYRQVECWSSLLAGQRYCQTVLSLKSCYL